VVVLISEEEEDAAIQLQMGEWLRKIGGQVSRPKPSLCSR
jgi:hypothetical protein